MKEYLVSLTAYNSWANMRILKFVTEAGEDRSGLMQSSSFSTIRQTVLHILDAQFVWFSRLHGVSPTDGPGKNFSGTAVDACMKLVESSKEFETYVASLSDADLQVLISYKTIKGDPFTSKIYEILAHAMNHGTYHRGQLITMLRGAGFTDLASTDLIVFFREQQK